jgi:hypothetical protein
MIPIPSGGIPTVWRTITMRGSDPPGTPAVPTPARIDMRTTVICCGSVRSMPNTCARKRTVTPSKSAVPFWLPVAPTVRTKFPILGGTPSFSAEVWSDVGRVAFEDAVENAVSTTSRHRKNHSTGGTRASPFRIAE